jgi:Glycosyl transferases group 1
VIGTGFTGNFPNRKNPKTKKGQTVGVQKILHPPPSPKQRPVFPNEARTAPPSAAHFQLGEPRIVAGPTPALSPEQANLARRSELELSRNSGSHKGAKPVRPQSINVGKHPRSGIAIIGKFQPWPWGQYPDESYLADALERSGIRVFRIPSGTSQMAENAEWILFTGSTASQISAWWGTHRTIIWTLDWLPGLNERFYIIEAGREADLFVTSDRYDWEAKYGIKNHVYLPGACEAINIQLDPRPIRPVAFLGSLYNGRRQQIASIVKSFGGEVLSIPGQWIYGGKLARYCQDTKIIVGDNIVNDCPGYWSSRNYVIPGAGGFLLTPVVPELDEQFSVDKNIACYTSLEDLRFKIGFYLNNDQRREEIRAQSFSHVQAVHNWTMRAKKLIEKMKVAGPR